MKTSLAMAKGWKAARYTAWRTVSRVVPALRSAQFTPFVLVTRSRSGSNLLKNFLNSSPEVECFGEIFRHPDRLGSPLGDGGRDL